MPSILVYALGPLYALLPRQFRERLHRGSPALLGRLTLISGILEFLVAMAVMRVWYLRFLGMLAANYTQYIYSTQDVRPYAEDAVRQPGLTAFLFTPLTWIIFFFAAEGLFRILVATASDEGCAAFPFFVLGWLFAGPTRRPSALQLPNISDEVTNGDARCDLKISSCGPKPDRKYPYTIRYRGTFFQVISARRQLTGSRPYVYRLRRLPPGETARGLRDYDPG